MTLEQILAHGYLQPRRVNGIWYALYPFNFTCGLVAGLEDHGYQRRYCYEHQDDAEKALREFNGEGHPGGQWIKCKGIGIDLLNPAIGKLF